MRFENTLVGVWADLAAATRFKNQVATSDPEHLPVHKVSRRAEGQFNLPVCGRFTLVSTGGLPGGEARWGSTQVSRPWLWHEEVHGSQAKGERIPLASAPG